MNETLTLHDLSKPVRLDSLPVVPYSRFRDLVPGLLSGETAHCLSYHAIPAGGGLLFLCLIADDTDHRISILAHDDRGPLEPLTTAVPALHVFERELHEQHGIVFTGHPWLKPLRFAHDRADPSVAMDDYPFYIIGSGELHQVGVGPVHAGVIEPGHFRFLCNGEKVLHLEIQLGYQHRGLGMLMRTSPSGLKRALLAESIAGDTAVGHAVTHAAVTEALSSRPVSAEIMLERAIALELERIAVHIGDSAALCTDVAYQLGQVVFESLRTTVINTTQQWCGNRFGKGLIRPHGTHFPLTREMGKTINRNLDAVMGRFLQMTGRMFTLPSVVSRFDGTGMLTRTQAIRIGAVGMAARMAGLERDIRKSHPGIPFLSRPYEPVIQESGDVMARARLRSLEAEKSAGLVREWTGELGLKDAARSRPSYDEALAPGALAIGLTEGWRGEICHVAVTGKDGTLIHYQVNDPSLHNWMALALAVRDQEISDFPVCNKSFNLSYCGHDL